MKCRAHVTDETKKPISLSFSQEQFRLFAPINIHMKGDFFYFQGKEFHFIDVVIWLFHT